MPTGDPSILANLRAVGIVSGGGLLDQAMNAARSFLSPTAATKTAATGSPGSSGLPGDAAAGAPGPGSVSPAGGDVSFAQGGRANLSPTALTAANLLGGFFGPLGSYSSLALSLIGRGENALDAAIRSGTPFGNTLATALGVSTRGNVPLSYADVVRGLGTDSSAGLLGGLTASDVDAMSGALAGEGGGGGQPAGGPVGVGLGGEGLGEAGGDSSGSSGEW